MSGGGSERVSLNLACGLRSLGINVYIVLACPGGALEENIPTGIDPIYLDSERKVLSAYRLAKVIDEERIDVIHSSLYRAAPVLALASILSRQKVSTVLEIENPLYSIYETEEISKRVSKRVVYASVFQFIDKLLPVSDDVAESASKFAWIPDHKMVTTPNPINLKDKQEKKHEYDLPDHERLIVSMGRLEDQKNFETLIRSFGIVAESVDAGLLIMGEGEERGGIERLISDLGLENRVYLPGFINNPSAVLSSADVFALSSQYEGFGNVLVEAMAVGLPVVSTNCIGGPSEILDGGEFGQLVPVGDHQAMAESILTALDEDENAQKLRNRASVYGIEKVSREYMDVFQECC